MDAEQEMDLVHHGAGRARVTSHKRVHVVDQNLPLRTLRTPNLRFQTSPWSMSLPKLLTDPQMWEAFCKKGTRGQYEYVSPPNFIRRVDLYMLKGWRGWKRRALRHGALGKESNETPECERFDASNERGQLGNH